MVKGHLIGVVYMGTVVFSLKCQSNIVVDLFVCQVMQMGKKGGGGEGGGQNKIEILVVNFKGFPTLSMFLVFCAVILLP